MSLILRVGFDVDKDECLNKFMRTPAEIVTDIISNRLVSRTDIADLIEEFSYKSEAKMAIEDAFSEFSPIDAGYDMSKERFIFRIFDDLDSYKKWEQE